MLLVTTSRSVLLVDPVTGEGLRIDSGRGIYYGIAEYHGRICIAARHRAADSTVPMTDADGEILIFSQRLEPTESIRAPFPLRDMHQILAHDNRLWVTCTFDNMIAVYDGAHWEKWFPLRSSRDQPGDVNHLNSLAIVEGQLCVLANNHGPSQILTFTLPERLPRGSLFLGNRAHNVWKRQGAWMTFSSGEGRIAGSDGFSLEVGGFPRGIAHAEGFIYVGLSDFKERSLRDSSNARIAIFDGQWNWLASLMLKGEGMVLDIWPLITTPKVLSPRAQAVAFDVWKPIGSESLGAKTPLVSGRSTSLRQIR